MESQTSEMTLRVFLAVVSHRRRIIIGVVVACVAAAAALSFAQTTVYTAKSEVLVQSRSIDVFDNQTATLNERSIQTQIEVIESNAVRGRVQQDLGLGDLTAQELDDVLPEVRAAAVRQTDVVRLTVQDTDAAAAAQYANAYATAYIDLRREQVLLELQAAADAVQEAIDSVQADLDAVEAIERSEDDETGDTDLPSIADELANFPSRTSLSDQLAEFSTTLNQLHIDAAVRTGDITIIRLAEVPEDPDGAALSRTLALAVFLGLALGLGAAFLVHYLDDKIRTEEELASLVARPVLAVVPVAKSVDNRLVAIGEPSHLAVEAYRDLRTNLRFLGVDSEVRIVQVTSVAEADGRTSTAANLAAVLAQAGHRVALVDADLRGPRVHEVLDVPQSPGFTDILLGMDATEAVNDVAVGDAHVMAAYSSGAVPTNPSEVLSGQRTREVLRALADEYEYVIVDAAPVLGVSDTLELSSNVDALLLVVRAGGTTHGQLAETVGRLERVGAPLVGMVLNQATPGHSPRKPA